MAAALGLMAFIGATGDSQPAIGSGRRDDAAEMM